ncbi:MAG: divergent polysaccharide deacetylase family protein [Deltaproteobacteria bacterium]|nr:divergent polysaccharide deacetylase family protein [Deltaproteobacteria bacterium]
MRTKTLFIFGIALGFFIMVIAGFILYYGYKSKEGEQKNLLIPPQVAKIEKPQLPPAKTFVPKAKVAIVIDDMGQDIKQLRELLEIDVPISIAVLPFLPYSKDVAKEANLNGREVLLHLPMEPKDSRNHDPGKGALFTDMSEAKVAEQVKKGIDAVPYITGINNHMGSMFTEDERLMKVVLEIAKTKNIFFLDSKTTNKSAAYRLAKEIGLRAASRQVFLDNKEDINYVKAQILELIEIAKKRGSAIAIGHPHPATILAIKEMIHTLNQDVNVVAVSSLIDSAGE